MLIKASTRPLGLKPGTKTEAFYKASGYKDPHGPDIRDVVGTLTLSARSKVEFILLRDLYRFFADPGLGNLTITINENEITYERPAETDEAA